MHTIEDETVLLDGKTFVGVTFRRCTIVYGGGNVPNLINNTFESCEWRFVGAAERTAFLMRQLATNAGGATLVRSLLGLEPDPPKAMTPAELQALFDRP